MSNLRPPLATSFAFATSPDPPQRLPKRRLSQLDFFTPAATSFKPRPYTPATDSSIQPNTSFRSATRNVDAHPLPTPAMDPLPSDPDVIFIHPPFTSFPNSPLYPDGLTFQLMAENPNWFLDAHDFVSLHNPNANLIPYPPHLEPPRGWCPAKKKDLKDRGSEGWPEGEEPRLRCTFCRRTYAGVNAKSMWRRHVFEKHKIAMSNRRDGSDRPRGRGSNKENRQVVIRTRQESHDKIVNLDVAPQTDPRSVSHKSRFRSHCSTTDVSRIRRNSRDIIAPLSTASQSDSTQDEPAACQYSTHALPLSPPLTPQSSSSSDPIHAFVEPATELSTPLPVVPPSPYDPLLTPSFRHSPPRLPSDQPWRFPSPSHPLHSRARELLLGMLVREANSPVMKGLPILGASPGVVQSSPVPSLRGKRNVFEVDTPESIAKSSGRSPRALFLSDRPPTPLGARLSSIKPQHRIAESPLHRSSITAARAHRRSESESTDTWLSEVSLMESTSSLGASELLTSGDPFATMYSSWAPSNYEHGKNQEFPSSPITSPQTESPVLRNTALPGGVGLGIGLLGPFSLLGDKQCPTIDLDNDFTNMLMYPPLEEEHDQTASPTAVENYHVTSPPMKKRKMSTNSLD